MDPPETDFLKNLFLFKNVPEEVLQSSVNLITVETKEYKAKERIYSPNNYEHKLGFVLSGKCLIERIKTKGEPVPLNVVVPGESFGIMAVLTNQDEYPTQISAITPSKILFINQHDVLNLIKSNQTIAMNVISFLADRISFLNKKIATFSSDTVEQKLASYILSEYSKNGTNPFTFNCKRSAEAINAGRASLYRAINSLSEKEAIKLVDKKIYISDVKSLERISK